MSPRLVRKPRTGARADREGLRTELALGIALARRTPVETQDALDHHVELLLLAVVGGRKEVDAISAISPCIRCHLHRGGPARSREECPSSSAFRIIPSNEDRPVDAAFRSSERSLGLARTETVEPRACKECERADRGEARNRANGADSRSAPWQRWRGVEFRRRTRARRQGHRAERVRGRSVRRRRSGRGVRGCAR